MAWNPIGSPCPEYPADMDTAGRPVRLAAAAVFLLDDLVTHVFADGSSKHLVRQVFLILNEKGQRSFTKFRVPSSSSFRLEVAETIQPADARQEATSIHRGAIHLPSLGPGSILHVAYRFDSASSSWMEDHYAGSFLFQGSHLVPRDNYERFRANCLAVDRTEKQDIVLAPTAP